MHTLHFNVSTAAAANAEGPELRGENRGVGEKVTHIPSGFFWEDVKHHLRVAPR